MNTPDVIVTGTGRCGHNSFMQAVNADWPVTAEINGPYVIRGCPPPARWTSREQALAMFDGPGRCKCAIVHNAATLFPELLDRLPDVKVVFLVRRAFQCVVSMTYREFAQQILGSEGDSAAVNAAYWARVVGIAMNAHAHAPDRVRIFRIEKDSFNSIASWIGLTIEGEFPCRGRDGRMDGMDCSSLGKRVKQSILGGPCAWFMDLLFEGWRDEPDVWTYPGDTRTPVVPGTL